MDQPGAKDPNEARDTTLSGPPAVPVRGVSATMSFQGQTPQDGDIERFFQTILEDADRYRRIAASKWLKLFSQYNCISDPQSKAEWQSNIFVPKLKQAVDISTARIMDSMISNEDFFDILPYTRSDDPRTDTAKKMIKWQLAKSSWKMPLKAAVKNALICGFGPAKITFEEDLDTITMESMPGQTMQGQQPRRRLTIDPYMPTDVWLDFSGRNRFVITRTKRSISDLWDMANQGIYDKAKVEQLRAGGTDPQREVEQSIIRRDTPYLNTDIATDIYEFWGDMYDPSTGAVIFKNIFATFAQKKVMIRRPQGNPFRHGRLPFIIFTANLSPHQIYGFGLIEPASLIQDSLNRSWNIIVDKQLLTVPMIQTVPGALRNPEELMGDHPKIVPGKSWKLKDGERPAFVPVTGFEKPSQEDFLITDHLSAMIDQATGVNEFATGTPQTQNRKTKEEVQTRTQATVQVFNDTAQHIEESALSPLIKMIYYLMVQYETEYDDQNLLQMMGGEAQQALIATLKMMPAEQRWRAMYLDAEFRVTGVSLAITREQRINRLVNFKQMISADPGMMMLINKSEEFHWWQKLFDLPDSLFLPFADALLQAEQQAQLAAVMGPPQPTPQHGQNTNNAQEQTARKAREAGDREQAGPNAQAQMPQ